MRLWASFLNNSSSRWEPIWENWPLHCELMDIVSPIYRSDFQRREHSILTPSPVIPFLVIVAWSSRSWRPPPTA